MDITENYQNISGVHVFAYEHSNIEDVIFRQNIAIQSYCQNKILPIAIIGLAKTDPKIPNIDYFKIDDINYNFFKCERDYYYLGSIIDYALSITSKEDYIIYTNSDCHIQNNFYNFILQNNYDCIEFFRVNVRNNAIVGYSKDGIDGFAIKNYILVKLLKDKILPYDLIIGAPYWDAVFSNIIKQYIPNHYQDNTRLFHNEHLPRWDIKSLDYGGNHNLELLNKLYNKSIIKCRKAEIKSDRLVIRIFNQDTDFAQIKQKICIEKFSNNKITKFNFNYLFIEIKDDVLSQSKLTDENLGTTAGTRYCVESNKVNHIIEKEKRQYKEYVILSNDETLQHSTQFIKTHMCEMGVVMAFFGQDPLRIRATQKCINTLAKQSIWNECNVVFVELIDKVSSFDLSGHNNVTHLKIPIKILNKNLFQKECLWNLGAKQIINQVDNFIFIDSDTYPENNDTFAKANKVLNFNPNIVYQLGNCIITQKENYTIDRIQWLWNSFAKLDAKQPYCFNPCGGFAISKKIFHQIKGFNPFGLLYGGDILFLYEIDKRTHHIWNYIIQNLNIFKNLPRKIDTQNIVLKNNEYPMIHCWHGSHIDRPYHQWGLAFNNLNFTHEDIILDEDGLLSWVDDTTMKKYDKFFHNKHKICDANIQKKLYL